MKYAFMLLLVVQAHAEDKPEVKLGGVLFAQGVMTTSPRTAAGQDGQGRSSFDVTRIYLIGDAKFNEQWKTRIVLEGNTNGTSAGQTNNNIFIKQAWVEYRTAPTAKYDVAAQAGQIPTSWDGLESGYNRRYILKALPDLNGLVPTADKGLGVYGTIPAGYGSYNAQVTNGAGVQATEGTSGASGRQKAYSLLVTLRHPDLKALSINLYGQQETQGIVSTVAGEGLLPSREKNRLFAGPALRTDKIDLMATYYYAPTAIGTTRATNVRTKAQGYSIHGTYRVLADVAVFGRFDRFDAGTGLVYMPVRTAVGGVEYVVSKYIKAAIADINTSSKNVNENQLGLFLQGTF